MEAEKRILRVRNGNRKPLSDSTNLTTATTTTTAPNNLSSAFKKLLPSTNSTTANSDAISSAPPPPQPNLASSPARLLKSSSLRAFQVVMGYAPGFILIEGSDSRVHKTCKYKGIMFASESVGNNTQKKLIQIDISSDTVFRGHGLEYDLSGLTGNTLDSHKLMHFAGQQGHDKQHNLMEVLSLGYFTQANLLVTSKLGCNV
ncbi:hypothetical protein CFP56_011235 [Quercus suber]|uniref:Uncharacterized protein n=1 Tax=Quercus suber TaxID=58331 RepID=A0AAW0MI06_QUESU